MCLSKQSFFATNSLSLGTIQVRHSVLLSDAADLTFPCYSPSTPLDSPTFAVHQLVESEPKLALKPGLPFLHQWELSGLQGSCLEIGHKESSRLNNSKLW